MIGPSTIEALEKELSRTTWNAQDVLPPAGRQGRWGKSNADTDSIMKSLAPNTLLTKFYKITGPKQKENVYIHGICMIYYCSIGNLGLGEMCMIFLCCHGKYIYKCP